MKKQLLILFTAATTIITACSKKDPNPVIPSKQLTKITETKNEQSSVFTLSYDSNKRLTSFKNANGSEASNFTYDAAGNLTKLEFIEGDSKSILEVTYNNGVPVTGKLSNESDDEDINLTYVVSNGLVTEIIQKQGTVEYGKSTITYQNGNVTKIKTEITAVPQMNTTATFTYGSKKNMFASAGFKYALDPMGIAAKFLAKNEMLSEKYEGAISSDTTYEYTYDADGYPLTGTDNEGVSYKYEYK